MQASWQEGKKSKSPQGWGSNSFGEPPGEQARPLGIGPSGPERSAANPILSATLTPIYPF